MDKIEMIRQEIERLKKCSQSAKMEWIDEGYNQNAFAEDCRMVSFEHLLSFIDSLPEETKNHGCGVEFPHFGANYPDAKCIDGYLWDMDSYEDGVYTIGGDDPCPICNTEEWLKDVLDDEIFKTRDEALEYVKMLKSKYKHKNVLPEEPDKSLDEAAEKYSDKYCSDWAYRLEYEDAFIAGAEWQYQKDRGEFAKLKAKEWLNGYDEGYAKGLNARKDG